MTTTLAGMLKAITAALVAGLTALATALEDGGITAGDWITVAITFLVALGAVWTVPNLPAPAKEQP
jgi:hypothetical protein